MIQEEQGELTAKQRQPINMPGHSAMRKSEK